MVFAFWIASRQGLIAINIDKVSYSPTLLVSGGKDLTDLIRGLLGP